MGQQQHSQKDCTDNSSLAAVLEENLQLKRRLHQLQQEFFTIFDSVPAMIWYRDRTGKILRANQCAATSVGMAVQDLSGRNYYELFPDGADKALEKDLRVILTGQPIRGKMRQYETAQGQSRWALADRIPYYDEQGNIAGVMVFAQDITERKQAEESLLKAKDEIEKANQQLRAAAEKSTILAEEAMLANRAKSDFLANMSHELRTPQLLQRGPSLSRQQREYLDIINRSGEHLVALINDVLEISRIEARRITLEPQVCDLHVLLRDLELMFRLRTEVKGLHFEVTGIDKVPRYVVVDENKLRQIMVNLLGNAVKYTLHGGVFVHLTAGRQVSNGLRLEVEVRDTGIGIAEDDLVRVFEYFEQAAGGHQTRSGTGLGLAISREYARMMGGDITVISRLGEGSTFRLEIDIQESVPLDRPEKVRENLVVGLEPGQATPRILVVEDQEESRRLLVQLLEDVGFEVREASEGLEAIRVFEEYRPHFIWMDMRMPGMDGLEATRRIKATDAGKKTVVAALTAHALEEEQEPILAAGCDELVRKPYREQELFEIMGRRLGIRYIYEGAHTGPGDVGWGAEVSSEEVAALPLALRKELHEALLRLNMARISAAIEKIAERDGRLGAALRRLAENMDYHRLLLLCEETGRDAWRGNI